MYAGVPLAGALGVGGASALACRRRSGFDTLATVVAATTLLMAGVSVCKLLPRRRTDTVGAGGAVLSAPDRLALGRQGERSSPGGGPLAPAYPAVAAGASSTGVPFTLRVAHSRARS
ncbi:hypothetical protein SAMN05216532_0469 [Streptomyces sp. 2231.1]|nr:hypothetical protein SAMN05216532_0469 [Streptomyces sp. 2231.1]